MMTLTMEWGGFVIVMLYSTVQCSKSALLYPTVPCPSGKGYAVMKSNHLIRCQPHSIEVVSSKFSIPTKASQCGTHISV